MGNQKQYVAWAREVFAAEALGLQEIAEGLNGGFSEAIDALLNCRGRVVIMGVGKSGHIGRKIAATMASTGTPAFFVHPAEAAHGDLGMIVDGDVVIALSNSGESDEIAALIPALKRRDVVLIGITARSQSTLAQHAHIFIQATVSQEACPMDLAPTTSTTAVLALGDALAVVLLRARAFSPDDFARNHPAGRLGKRLLTRVADIMHSGEALPAVPSGWLLKDAIVQMSSKGLGMLAVVDAEQRLLGIFTDGDLRRLFQYCDYIAQMKIDDVMHVNPKTISADKLATEAWKMMQDSLINGLLVVDEQQRLIGALNMHDLLQARII